MTPDTTPELIALSNQLLALIDNLNKRITTLESTVSKIVRAAQGYGINVEDL